MRRTLFVVLLGILAGCGTYEIWLRLRAPTPVNSIAADVAWMKANLKLSDAQVAKLQELHERSAPRLLALAGEVANMHQELAAFERARQTSGRIDFLEFARFIDQRRLLDKACADSTRSLVSASAEVMTAGQREQYFNLVEPAITSSPDYTPH